MCRDLIIKIILEKKSQLREKITPLEAPLGVASKLLKF